MANESMIAACPKCAARYRLERARLRSEGVRLRCTRCEAVFRVTPPAGVSAPPEASAAPATGEASKPEPSQAVSRELPPVAPQVVSPPQEVVSPAPQAVSPPPQGVSPAPQAVSPSPEGPVPSLEVETSDLGAPVQPAAMESAMPASDAPAPRPAMTAQGLAAARQGLAAPPQVAPPAAFGQRPVPPPDPDSQPPAEAERRNLVLLADSDVDAGKGLASTLASWGLEPLLVHDGVEAILTIQRALPRLVILDAALPKMFGFQVCELMKRNESLRSIHVVLIGAIHHRDRYRRAPSEIYGADAYTERPELPEALRPILSRFGLTVGVPAELVDSPPAVKRSLGAPDAAPMLDPLLEVEPAPEPMLEVDPAPEPLLEGDPAPGTLLEVDPAPGTLLEVAASDTASSEPELSGVAVARPQVGSEVLAEPEMEPLDAGLDQDFEVLDVDDDSFDEQMPIEPLAGDLLAEPLVSAPEPLVSGPEPIISAPEPLAEPEPLLPQPPPAVDASELEPPTAELPVQVQAPEPADPAVSAAERLARIIVSDVVLYNPEKFEEGVRVGNVVELLDAELEEGRGLFEQRVAPELRTGRDFLADELVRVARSRGMQA